MPCWRWCYGYALSQHVLIRVYKSLILITLYDFQQCEWIIVLIEVELYIHSCDIF